MKPFAYITARNASAAVDLVREDGRFLAGGVDLLGEMKEGIATPARLVNIKTLPGTNDLTPGPNRWTIGANVTLTVLATHAELRRVLPGLAEAAGEVGSPQMRNIATVGGNLAQHSRCWYYRQRDVKCAKKAGRRCYARGGEDKFHSLFNGGMCLSPCASNLAIMLTALDASVVVQRGAKTVNLSMAELYERAWRTRSAHHSLQDGDLILRVEIPTPATGARSVYLQQAERGGFDWALVSCAVSGRVEGGRWRGVRVALGCVAPIPWTQAEADALLEGQEVNAANANAAAARLLEGAEPREHNGYKVPLAGTLVRRALLRLAAT